MKKLNEHLPRAHWDQDDLDDIKTFEKIRHPASALIAYVLSADCTTFVSQDRGFAPRQQAGGKVT